ncbi:hypothetical protein EVAR_84248_1 [Eumeta japonica]|uniref:Uncharacterized protein n=1 Tax=Eumeta variegata TaxID=151549 RepID=A0A4C1WUH5_EUMVA|nr:hypothetical protein EVAR_84248_1 [Eumeta japonica]
MFALYERQRGAGRAHANRIRQSHQASGRPTTSRQVSCDTIKVNILTRTSKCACGGAGALRPRVPSTRRYRRATKIPNEQPRKKIKHLSTRHRMTSQLLRSVKLTQSAVTSSHTLALTNGAPDTAVDRLHTSHYRFYFVYGSVLDVFNRERTISTDHKPITHAFAKIGLDSETQRRTVNDS